MPPSSSFNVPTPILTRRILSALTALIWLAFSWRYRGHEIEDGLIYWRYLANALDGHGFVFNVGEYVNGLTSPLYAFILLAGARLSNDIALAAVVASAVASALCALLLVALFERARPEAPPSHSIVPALFLATSPYTYANYGMEASLFAALSGLSLWLYLQKRTRLLSWALAAIVLARPEGVLLIATLALDSLLSPIIDHGRRQTAYVARLRPLILFPAAALAVQLAANTAYYGAPLSASAMAKVGQGSSGLWWNANFVLATVEHVDRFFGGSWPAALTFGALSAFGIATCSDRQLRRVALIFMAALTTFYVALRIPSQDWYYAPLYFFAWMFAAIGWSELGTRLRQRYHAPPYFEHTAEQQTAPLPNVPNVPKTHTEDRSTHIRPAAVTLTMAGLMLLATLQPAVGTWQGHGVRSMEARREIGNWLAEHTPQDASVAMCEIGGVGWYSRRYIVDILGLVRPANAASIARGDVHEWLARDRPDFILIHDPPWHLEAAAPASEARGEYTDVAAFNIEGYRLLARNEIPANFR